MQANQGIGVNFFQHQELFYDLVASSDAINFTQIAIYQAMFRFWNHQFFQNPVQVDRESMMILSGIKSRSAFYRALRGLDAFDLIRYYPTRSVYEKSYLCFSTFSLIDKDIKVSVWGLVEPKVPGAISSKDKTVVMVEKIKLYNGRYQLEKIKEVIVKKKLEILPSIAFNNKNNGTGSSHQNESENLFGNHFKSSSKFYPNGNYQKSEPRNGGLRPPGIPLHPDPDYTKPL
ncbi:MAG: hypothetical protein WBO36_07640 [Saprospiraceae bacterium]